MMCVMCVSSQVVIAGSVAVAAQNLHLPTVSNSTPGEHAGAVGFMFLTLCCDSKSHTSLRCCVSAQSVSRNADRGVRCLNLQHDLHSD